MTSRLHLIIIIALLIATQAVSGQTVGLSGRVVSQRSGQPVEFASVLLVGTGQWAITDEKGRFALNHAPTGRQTLTVQCLGYAKLTLPLNVGPGLQPLTLRLAEDNLQLDEVTVVAQRRDDAATTSYTIDRNALDNQQIVNLAEVATLLPGGKTQNPTLMSDSRLALRAGSSEKGNASFGTAIEVDGVRLNNNAETGETLAASTRAVSSASIESVEVVAGIASVEYGDMSNGIVKVRTRRGKSPYMVEGKLNPHTRQVALSKGFDLKGAGVLNLTLEHARSFSNLVSPYTAYQRNVLTVNYMDVLMRQTTPLTVNFGLTGNVGGYNSEADPDQDLDDYTKARDNNLRAHVELNWLLNRTWITNVELRGTLSVADKLTEQYASRSSASTQPYIHSREEGYFIAQDYDRDPSANIILGPTGYWYVRGFNASKPLTANLKLKGEWNRSLSRSGERISRSEERGARSENSNDARSEERGAGSENGDGARSILSNRVMAGAEFNATHNGGRGTYYDDMRLAPTWREYRYDRLPWMRNVALFAEDRLTVGLFRQAEMELTAGLRQDITLIGGTDYGTVQSLSPRANLRLVLWRDSPDRWLHHLSLHAGMGKSVKLPSFEVLYPTPSYADRLAFSSQSTTDNRSYYAYHTYPSAALYNPNLRWQYTHQTDIGVEFTLLGTQVSLSAFRHRTHRSYMQTDVFTPMTYRYTPPSAMEQSGISVENARYEVDRQTGIVTVTDLTGEHDPVQLAYNERQTYTVNARYVNGTPIERRGMEWIIDFAPIRSLRTRLRLDGNYYYYKGIDDVLFADIPLGVNSTMSGGRLYQYVGYYRGSNVTSASYSAGAAISNGTLKRQANLNATVTTHIPRIRLILSLRAECSLYRFSQALSEFSYGTRGIVLDDRANFFGEPYDGTSRDKFLAIYPEYYTTWDRPDELIPFAERFVWARDNDPELFSDLSRLIVRSNYAYVMNPSRLDRYYSANLSVTKEIGDHVSISFYANNFFNNMKRIRDSQTDVETSLFGSGYIPSFYYGLSLRLKI